MSSSSKFDSPIDSKGKGITIIRKAWNKIHNDTTSYPRRLPLEHFQVLNYLFSWNSSSFCDKVLHTEYVSENIVKVSP